MPSIDSVVDWTWLRKGSLKFENMSTEMSKTEK